MNETRRWGKGIVVGISLFIIGTGVTPFSAYDHIELPALRFEGNWHYVGGTGPGNYTRIQDAIDNASCGDFVYVYSGVYPEHIQIQKNITVLGENKNETIIDGQQASYDILTILASAVTLTGFSMKNNSLNHSCITIQNASNCSLDGNAFHTMCGHAVQINNSGFIELNGNSINGIMTEYTAPIISLHSSHNCTIIHNIIENTKQTRETTLDGIVADDCKNVHISSNTISKVRHGINVFGESIEISYNTVTDCSIGIACTAPENSDLNSRNITIKDNILLRNTRSNIYLQVMTQAVLSGNQVQDSPDYGIYIEDTFFSRPEQITIIDNDIVSNRCGIEIVSASQVLVEQNQIQYNDVGISIDYCTSSYIRNNTFLGNNNSATFQWFWFFSALSRVRDKIPKFHNNFWDQKRTTPQPIIGRWHLWSPLFPHVNFLLWITCDWHPATEPYEIQAWDYGSFL